MFASAVVAGVLAIFSAMPVTAFTQAADSALNHLTSDTITTTQTINTGMYCSYTFRNTTEAIQLGAPIMSGSACSSADMSISGYLLTLNTELIGVINSFSVSSTDNELAQSTVISDFNTFTNAFYALYNALDLAECTYVLTPASQAHGIIFATLSTLNQPGTLQGGYDALVAQLNSSLPVRLGIAYANSKMQTHFAGTSTLADTVGAESAASLLACLSVTAIVNGEGGPTTH